MIKERDYVVFVNDNAKMLWLEEQLRILWEFLDEEGLADEADQRIKDELDTQDLIIENDNR